jgi:hypothetical protein
MQMPENLNDNAPWFGFDVEDLRLGIEAGESLAEIADFLQGDGAGSPRGSHR